MKATGIKELKALTEERDQMYRFLSRVYQQEADAKLLRSLSLMEWSSFIAQNPGIREGWQTITDWLSKSKISKKLVEELAVDFASIFLGHGKHPVHPYESVYRGKDRVVMQEPWQEVTQLFAAEGLVRSKEFNEPEDHIAIELEFMAYLCRKELEYIDQKENKQIQEALDKQKKFIDEHLLSWIPGFCEDVRQAAELPFYQGLARFTAEFISADSTNIKRSVSLISN